MLFSTLLKAVKQALARLQIGFVRKIVPITLLMPPLTYLSLAAYLDPPSSFQKAIGLIASTAVGWLLIMAAMADATGYHLRDIWHNTAITGHWLRKLCIIHLFLGIIFLGALTLITIRWASSFELRKPPITTNKIKFLVAEFSESARTSLPSDGMISYKIKNALDTLALRHTDITIEKLERVIDNPDTAMKIGEIKGATAVIWGVYAKSPTTIILAPHLSLISPELVVYTKEHLLEPKERRADIQQYFSFQLHFELQREIAFLSSFVAGLAHFSMDRYDEALADLNHSLHLATDSKSLGLESIYYYKGVILRLQGAYAEAEIQFREAISANPNFAEGYNGLGLTFYDQGKINEAIAQYSEAIKCDPKFAYAFNNLALVYEDKNRPVEERIRLYLRAIEIDSTISVFYQNLGVIYHNLDRYQEAQTQYKKAIQSNPFIPSSYLYLAYLYIDMAKWEDAKKNAQQVLNLAPHNPFAFNQLGLIYYYNDKPKQAIATFKRAIEINPKEAQFHNNLGLVFEEEGKDQQAIAEYKEAVNLSPKDTAVLGRLANLYLRVGRFEEGMKFLSDCVALLTINPEDPNGHNQLSQIYMAQKKYEQAIHELLISIHQDSLSYVYHSNLAEAYRKIGQYQNAISEIQHSLRLSPYSHKLHLTLLNLKLDSKDYFGAAQQIPGVVHTLPLNLKFFYTTLLFTFLVYFYFIFIIIADTQRGARIWEIIELFPLKCIAACLATFSSCFIKINALIKGKSKKGEKTLFKKLSSKLNHSLAKKYYSQAFLNIARGQSKNAEHKFLKALDLYPDFILAMDGLVNLYYICGDRTAAYSLVVSLALANPRNAIFRIRIGDILFTENMADRAITEWKNAVQIDAESVIAYLESQLQQNSTNQAINFVLGLAYEAISKNSMALELFKISILFPYNRLLRQIAEQKIQLLS